MIACSVAPALLQPVPKAHYSSDVLPPVSGCY
ncbi:BgTH12-03931 [Blumeria graminis f. sp. triticale]|uniref:Bgt-51091 n=2 Tax=Blumeria graminis TaxID=34373 RepID=A0A9X9L939_BLUGR|nr:BgTH12-03931 [Blumeria graminis f. sp. triticale]VCU39995.1 Bgt-51091 [Blumeria graminis f. sp. tritici]